MLASPIATLSLRAIAIGASAPLAARERPERYEPCTAVHGQVRVRGPPWWSELLHQFQ